MLLVVCMHFESKFNQCRFGEDLKIWSLLCSNMKKKKRKHFSNCKVYHLFYLSLDTLFHTNHDSSIISKHDQIPPKLSNKPLWVFTISINSLVRSVNEITSRNLGHVLVGGQINLSQNFQKIGIQFPSRAMVNMKSAKGEDGIVWGQASIKLRCRHAW